MCKLCKLCCQNFTTNIRLVCLQRWWVWKFICHFLHVYGADFWNPQVLSYKIWTLKIDDLSQSVVSFSLFSNTTCVRVNIMSGSCGVICMLFLYVYFAVWTIFFSLIMQQRKLVLCDIIRCLWFKPQAPRRPLRENTICNSSKYILGVSTLNHAKTNCNSLQLAVDVLDTWTSMLILFINYRWLNWWRIDKTSCLL